jgi:hypothetical protein
MGLEEALKAYSNEIQVITLRDGTNIEIISNDQYFRIGQKYATLMMNFKTKKKTIMILLKKI